MQTKYLFIMGILAAAASLAACSGTLPTPATAAAPISNQPLPAAPAARQTTPTSAASNSAKFETETVDGGSVSVAVTPQSLSVGAPLEFEIAMNTHSVDLSNDLLKAVVLRDDAGKEYAPTAWDGPTGGGHHRSGKIEFAALTASTRSITLIVKNVAGVPERTFSWEWPR